MWLVRLALSRPKAVGVLVILIGILGVLSAIQAPKDIFPSINIPVVSVIWSYDGLAPQEMEQRVVNLSERAFTTTVANIDHIESQSYSGVSVIKVYFQPGADIGRSIAQISATSETILRFMPPGMTPPLILQYDATDVPIVQVSLSSNTYSTFQLFDYAMNFLRPQLITIRGASISLPYGGAGRQIMVDLDPKKMLARGVSGPDVASALASQNLILPAGDAKMGVRDYRVRINNSPSSVEDFNKIPIKMVNGAVVTIGDVAYVHDGHSVQTNIVRVNGEPAVLLTVFKSGNASTLDVLSQIRAKLPQIRATLPPGMEVHLLMDQSFFVRAAIFGVVREAAIAAALTALMILLFLGSWRSMLIVASSIPLSILSSIALLHALGYTLNTLTLGGLALAVGMLVDDATVEIENSTRLLRLGYGLREAILTSAQQVALPALASTLSICIVFVPISMLSGVAQSLFAPLGLAVVLAMLPSYLLSRTLVTTMMRSLLGKELDIYQHDMLAEREGMVTNHGEDIMARRNIVERFLWRLHELFEGYFDSLREHYHNALEWVLHHRPVIAIGLPLFFIASILLIPVIGQDFFPQVDAGQIRLHVRAPAGTRLEETAKLFTQVEQVVRQVIPKQELSLLIDNIGISGGLNFAYSSVNTISTDDGEIYISLTEKHHPVAMYQQELRKVLAQRFPQCTFYFQPADLVTQVLDFGTSAPIDIQVTGPYFNQAKNLALAKEILRRVSKVEGVVDPYLYQVTDAPELRVHVDRTRAMMVGLTQQRVAGSVLDMLSSSSLVSPSFYLDPHNGVQYAVVVQTPQYRVSSIPDLLSVPITNGTTGGQPQLLANLATVTRDTTPEVISHYNIQPVYDVLVSVQGRDLGSTVADIQHILARLKKQVPRGSQVHIVGQAQTMVSSFHQLGFGLIFAIVLIYLLLTVNFESWLDPFIVMMAAPGALAGVVWMLYVTQTTFNVPSLMGTIMGIGVATANSILLVTFANEQRQEGKDPVQAALAAGTTRFRPVIMTALAMIIGMLPMALGMGEGGEMNAPLGRAAIGGLLLATVTTLFFVPTIYSIIHLRLERHREKLEDVFASPTEPETGA